MKLPITIGLSPTLNIRGILATEPIRKGRVIERCPVVILPGQEYEHLEQTVMTRYYYRWTARAVCVVFGYGSLYNHSDTANVHFHRDFRNHLMVFTALRDIAPGEELTIDYNQGTDDTLPPEYLDYNAHEHA